MRRLVALANSLGGTEEDDIMDAVAKLAEAAAFLDGLAGRVERAGYPDLLAEAAADCRTMAAKLRKEK